MPERLSQSHIPFVDVSAYSIEPQNDCQRDFRVGSGVYLVTLMWRSDISRWMNTNTLLADPAALRLEKIVSENTSITFVVTTKTHCAECPRCGVASARRHSRYTRRVADLPWQGVAVRLELHARKFRCANDVCQQTIFCERLPSVVARYARRTTRLEDALTLIGFA